jgi:hypothetical protein
MTLRPSAFSAHGHWFRGNLHTHSTFSDGKCTPAEVVHFYRQQGYAFVAFTDHLIVADAAGLSSQDFLVIPGVEIHHNDLRGSTYHVVGIGGALPASERMPAAGDLTADAAVLRALGALVFAAHPYWSGQTSAELLDVPAMMGIEIYNGTADVGYHKGFSLQTWDELLIAGRRVWGLAVDDAHWLPWRMDAGLGWVMVRAQELTEPAILQALARGDFYSSTGPVIEDVWVEEGQVCVGCSPAVAVYAVGDRWHCSAAKAANVQGITHVCLPLWPEQSYVRVEVVDRLGRTAWSNPVFLT